MRERGTANSAGPRIAELDSLESVDVLKIGHEVATDDDAPTIEVDTEGMHDDVLAAASEESSEPSIADTPIGRSSSQKDVSQSPGMFDFDELEKSFGDDGDDDVESDAGEMPNLSDSEDEEPVPMWKHLGRPEPIEKSWDDIVQSMIGLWENRKPAPPPTETEAAAVDEFIMKELGALRPSTVVMHGWMGIMSPAMRQIVEAAEIEYKIMVMAGTGLSIDEAKTAKEELRDVGVVGREGPRVKAPTSRPPARRVGMRRDRLARGVTVDSGGR